MAVSAKMRGSVGDEQRRLLRSIRFVPFDQCDRMKIKSNPELPKNNKNSYLLKKLDISK